MNKLLINNVLVAEVSHYDLNKPLYKIILDDGKPSEHNAYNDEDLKEQLKEFYNSHKESDAYYNADVLRLNEYGVFEDISESMFIVEIISEILDEVKNEI